MSLIVTVKAWVWGLTAPLYFPSASLKVAVKEKKKKGLNSMSKDSKTWNKNQPLGRNVFFNVIISETIKALGLFKKRKNTMKFVTFGANLGFINNYCLPCR